MCERCQPLRDSSTGAPAEGRLQTRTATNQWAQRVSRPSVNGKRVLNAMLLQCGIASCLEMPRHRKHPRGQVLHACHAGQLARRTLVCWLVYWRGGFSRTLVQQVVGGIPLAHCGALSLLCFRFWVLHSGNAVALARLIEQPQSSIMRHHPRLAALISLANDGVVGSFHVVRCWLGPYGSCSPKPVQLFGTARGTQCLTQDAGIA